MRVNEALWQGTTIPEWDPERFLALFARQMRQPPGFVAADGPLAGRERDEFCRLLMHFVAIKFAKEKWLGRLPQAGLDPRDVAQDLVEFLLRKSPGITVRAWVARPDLPTKDRYKLLFWILNTSMKKRVATLIGERRAKVQEQPATDRMRRRGRDGNEDRGLDTIAGPASASSYFDESGVLRRLFEEKLDDVCGGVDGDINDVLKLYRYQRMSLLGRGRLVPYNELPQRLRVRIIPPQHFLVMVRMRLVLESLAAA